MNISVASSDLQYTLEEAILVYRAKQNEVPFITCHSVVPPVTAGGHPTLGVARPINQAFVRSLSLVLASKVKPEILPENVLFAGGDTLLWWTPASRRPMYFLTRKGEDEKDIKSIHGATFPHPPLVFMAETRGLTVRALSSNTRPSADTPLMIAPYWNVFIDGSVCLGPVRRPKTLSSLTIPDWQNAFFDSQFSHPNTPLLAKSPKGMASLWKSIAGKQNYPMEVLIPAKQTLADLLR